MKQEFGKRLTRLRQDARLTNLQLADRAGVPRSLISGMENGKRCMGEIQARRVGIALGLVGEALEDFIFRAMSECTEKVLAESQAYPAQILNLLARKLRQAGIIPELVAGCRSSEDSLQLFLEDGRQAILETRLAIV